MHKWRSYSDEYVQNQISLKIVGLTGGIGSGKTTIAKIFAVLGVSVYNSDERAKMLYFQSSIKAKIIELLGSNAYHRDGTLNSHFISDKVFNSNELREKVDKIIHPAVKNDFECWSENQFSPYIIKESALLFETGIYKNLYKNILVTSPVQLRIARVKKRNSITEEEIIKRINVQMKDERKVKLADFVVINDETKLILPQVLTIHDTLMG